MIKCPVADKAFVGRSVMKRSYGAALISALIFFCGSATFAQGFYLKDRTALEIDFGMWGGSKVSNTIGIGGIQSTANTSAFVGSIVYSYGLRENMAVTLSAGVLTAGASANVGLPGVSQQSGVVVPILIGMRYFVPYPESESRVLPFLSLGIGTYLGFEQNSSVGLTVVQESHSEGAFGGRLGAGIDFYVGDYFKFVVNAGYNLMADFSAPVTGRSNFNGGDFSLGIGYAF